MHLEEQVLKGRQLEEEVVEDWRGILRPGDTCKSQGEDDIGG